jgi:hypothetical protein
MIERRISATPHDPTALEKRGLQLLAVIESTAMTDDINSFLKFLLKQAQIARSNAAFGGAMHDGGASQLEDQVEVYLAGIRLSIPEQWTSRKQKHMRETDPDYAVFLKLKEKFGE